MLLSMLITLFDSNLHFVLWFSLGDGTAQVNFNGIYSPGHEADKTTATTTCDNVLTHPLRSLSITIFCSPDDRLLFAGFGVEVLGSEADATGTAPGLVSTVLTSLKMRGKGPSFAAVAWRTDKYK